MSRLALPLLCHLAFGCSVVNDIDVCDRAAGPIFEAHTSFRGNREVTSANSLVPLPDGRALLFYSAEERGTTERQDEVHGVRLDPEGISNTCDDVGEHVYVPAAGPGVLRLEIAAAGPSRPTELGLVAYVESGATDTPGVFIADFRGGNVCPANLRSPALISDEPAGAEVHTPVALRTAGDEFLVLWTSGADGFERNVKARAVFVDGGGARFRPLMEPSTGEVTADRPVNVSPPGDGPIQADAALVGDDRVAIGWISGELTGERRMRVGIYDRALRVIVPPFDVGEAGPRLPNAPELAFDGAQLLALWTAPVGDRQQVVGRLLTADGDFLSSELAPHGEVFPLGTSRTSMEGFPAVAARPEGGFFVAWTRLADEAGTTGSMSVWLTALDGDGARQFLNGACDRGEVPLTAPVGAQYRPAMAILGDGTLAMAWTDLGTSSSSTTDPFIRATFLGRHALLPVE